MPSVGLKNSSLEKSMSTVQTKTINKSSIFLPTVGLALPF